MRIVLIRELRDLLPWEQPWRQLQRGAGCDNPFLGWEWIANWFGVYRPVLRPRIALALDAGGALVGALAMQQPRIGPFAPIEVAGARAGGDDLDLLWSGGTNAADCDELVRAVLPRRRVGFCRWRALAAEGRLAAMLARPGAWNGWTAQCDADDVLPFLDLPRCYEDLLAAKSANFRAEMRRRRREWTRSFGAPELRIASAPEEVERDLAVLFRLHNLRRARLGQRGIFRDRRRREFHRRVAAALARREQARLYLLLAGGEPAAALYGLVSPRRFYFFQSGLDPRWLEHNPGTILIAAVVEDLIARGSERFELLRGAEPYKLRWSTGQRTTVRVTLTSGGLARRALAARAAWRQRHEAA